MRFARIPTARTWLWCAVLLLFIVSGLRGLQVRRLDFEADPLGFRRVAMDAHASEEVYLGQFGFSVAGVDQALADMPADEPMVLVHREDAAWFQEFSILSYAMWPRRLFAVVCTAGGEADRTAGLPPPVEAISLALVDLPGAMVVKDADTVRQLGLTAWLVRTSAPRAWTSFCR